MDTTLPHWLTPAVTDGADDIPRFPTTKEHREIEEIRFASVFERVLEGLEEGKLITHTIKEYPTEIDLGKFMRWIRKDQERFQRFEEAKQNGMVVKEEQMLTIAEGTGIEDVQRSKLQVDAIKWVMQAWDRKRYGDRQQIDATVVNIDMVDAIQRAEQMRMGRQSLTLTQDGEVVNG